jgi:hypothetical protein
MYVARERGATWTLTPSLKLAAAKMEAPGNHWKNWSG